MKIFFLQEETLNETTQTILWANTGSQLTVQTQDRNP